MSVDMISGRLSGLKDVEEFEKTPEEVWLRPETVYNAFLTSVAKHKDKNALIVQPPGDPLGDGRHISYGELLGYVNQTGNMFLDAGLREGETITHLLPQCPQGYFTLMAGEAVGIVNAVNPMLEESHILGIMKAANTTILVVPGPDLNEEVWKKVTWLIEQLPTLKKVFVVGGGAGCDGDKIVSFDSEMKRHSKAEIIDLPTRGLDDVVGYYHTGGTTGLPKLVPHTNRMQLIQLAATGYLIGYSDKDCTVTGLPLFHISGSVIAGIIPLCLGTKLVIASPLGWRDPLLVGNYWKIVEKFGVTVFGTVPTVLSALLNIPSEGCDISSLRIGITGGSGSPLEVLDAISKLSGITMLEGYGMTEVTSYTTLVPRDGDAKFGSVGVREPYVQIKAIIMDEDGNYVRDAKTDEVGVIVMKGTCVMPGYVQTAHNSAAFPMEGWLNSGDLGRIDADGCLWLTGRSKDLIIRSGHNIDPSLIEEPLHEHPAVELAAAVGRPDDYAGEMPIAYVQLKPGQTATPEELQEFARERILERAANPAEIIIIDEMPLTGVGKIFKPALREMASLRVAEAVLEDIKSSVDELSIRMGNDPKFGLTAFVSISGGDASHKEQIKKRLGVYTFHCEIAD
ncbi:acyl-CoA synthetase [Sneathiella limimaris]|uniref:acyl-CoA synthetase n=1 Tax=Sneathiella limimaris TaxID=1964213 RepID=UPI00146A4296|nr:acyl-CoA synthetase [Sneathiella limimaris]